jgi:hypothetical protein
MKKIYTLAIALFATSMVFAQDGAKSTPSSTSSEGPSAGNIYLSGLVNIASEGKKDGGGNKQEKSFNFGLIPVAGYMINDKIGVHALIGYNSATGDTDVPNAGGKYGTSTFMFGVGGRYLMGKGKLYFSPSVNLIFGSSTNKREVGNAAGDGFDYEKSGTSSSVDIGVLPAVTYFFNNNWSGEFAVGRLGYKSESTKDKDGTKTGSVNNFDLKVDLTTVNIGISYWFK